jgi:hypothetical protein
MSSAALFSSLGMFLKVVLHFMARMMALAEVMASKVAGLETFLKTPSSHLMTSCESPKILTLPLRLGLVPALHLC